MDKRTVYSELIKESCTVARLDSGLTVYVVERPCRRSSYAVFGTKYGSTDTAFSVGAEQPRRVPDGIAHYLEHKLFESEERDAFALFNETGANANAYTSFDRTCYLFSCSDNFYKNFDILLDFVTHPYFTPETVAKEQGIIGQEIKMYEDDPNWRVFFNTLTAMYRNNSVKVDIAGTVESISEITAELLYKCYNTFYDPSNMFICVVGNVDADKVIEAAKSVKTRNVGEIHRVTENEPEETATERIEVKLSTEMPKFTVGIKEKVTKPLPTAAEAAVGNVTASALFGRSSAIYSSLLSAGLINEKFSAEYFFGRGHASMLISGDSTEPDKVLEEIKKYIASLQKTGLSADAVETAKRREYGRSVLNCNSADDTASELVDCAVFGWEPFALTEAYASVTPEQVNARIRAINLSAISLSVVK